MSAMFPTIDLIKAFGPYKKQAEMLASPARYRYFLAGRMAGKSWTCGLDAVFRALVNPGVPGLLSGRNETDIKKVLLPHVRRHLETFKKVTGIELVKRYSGNDMCIELINGSVIHWRGWGYPDKLRGLDLGWALFDETEWGPVDSQTLLNVIAPAVRVACPYGGVGFYSSPNGHRYALKTWLEQCANENKDYWITHCSSYANPHVDPSIIDGLKANMSERRWKTEVLALPLRPVGAVFDSFTMARHGEHFDWRSEVYNCKLVIGADFGTSHAAAVAILVDQQGVWHVVKDLAVEPQTLGHFRIQLHSFIDQFPIPPHLIVGDRAIPDEIRSLRGRYEPKGATVRWCDTKDDQLITKGIGVMQDWLDPADGSKPKLMFHHDLPRVFEGTTAPIIPAMQAYRFRLDFDGTTTDQPFKDNVSDHSVDSLRYAVVRSLDDEALHGGRVWSRSLTMDAQ